MLKADLHIHTSEDTKDHYIKYSARELIDKASSMGYQVLSITLHNTQYYDEIKEYAQSKGILLIPGVEKNIEGKHTLLYNFSKEELSWIRHFEDLRKIDRKNKLVIAAHPFFKTSTCIGIKLKKYIDVFDAFEYSFFFNHIINFNKKAVKLAKKFGKTLIGTSDLHYIDNFGTCFSMIDAEKDIDSIIQAIKSNKVQLHAKPLSLAKFFNIAIKLKLL